MSTTYVGTLNQMMVLETCCNCGMIFGMTKQLNDKCRSDHEIFYCPRGHPQHYTGPSEESRLKAELEEQKRNADNLRAARDAALDQARHSHIERRKLQTRMKNLKTRIGNGVCPCCDRQFVNLQEHMKCEHPAFKNEEPA